MAKKKWYRLFFRFIFPFRISEKKTKRQKKVFRDLWTTIWKEEGYTHGRESLPKIEAHYNLYEPFSTDLILYFGLISIGTIRLIWNNNVVGLPVLNDFEIQKIWDGRVVEATLLTLKKRWRRWTKHIPSLILWREAYRRAKAKRMEGIVMAADIRLFKLLCRFFPFKQIGKEQFYEGSITVPAHLSLKEADEIVPKTHSVLAQFFFA